MTQPLCNSKSNDRKRNDARSRCAFLIHNSSSPIALSLSLCLSVGITLFLPPPGAVGSGCGFLLWLTLPPVPRRFSWTSDAFLRCQKMAGVSRNVPMIIPFYPLGNLASYKIYFDSIVSEIRSNFIFARLLLALSSEKIALVIMYKNIFDLSYAITTMKC